MQRGHRWWGGILIVVTLAAGATQLTAGIRFFEDQRYLSNLMNSIAIPALPPSEQVKAIVGYLETRPAIDNPGYCLLPVFRVLRPTARQVAESGGDCADRGRLIIRLLALRGIEASKWALYSPDGQPRHAAVEVDVETGRMAVDPLYGLWFPRPAGGYYGIKELKANPALLETRIRELVTRGENPGIARLDHYPLDSYVYGDARTINWDKSGATHVLYQALKLVLGPRVDDFQRPRFVEEPALMIIFGMAWVEGAVLIVWLLAARPRRVVGAPRLVIEARR